jgi:transcriptional regulator with XRE-family HTH domain
MLRTLQRIEKGETIPRGNTLKLICSVLEINIEDILDYGKTEDNKYIMYFHLSVLTFGILTGSLFVYTDKYINGSPVEENYFYPVLAIEAILYLLNFIYPVVVSILISRYGLRKYYYPLIRFIKS